MSRAAFLFAILLQMCTAVILTAQERIVVSGTVMDCETREPLQGCSVVEIRSGTGAVTAPSGDFTIALSPGKATLRMTYIGYAEVDTNLTVSRSIPELKICLSPSPVQYDEVVVKADEKSFTEAVRMGDVTLSREVMERMPKFLGEADPIRLLQLTPGVQSSTEGGVGFYVRGGNLDQNLVLFDGATVYNPGHLMGFVSAFNPDVLQDVSLVKSGIPARFGGRLSSVLQVNPLRGRSDTLHMQGQVGLVASRLTLNRSFAGNRGSFVLAARGASMDLFVKPVIFPLLADVNPFLNQSSYSFYDFNGGISYRLGERDYIHFTAFYNNDRFAIERSERMAETGMDWGNFILSGKWSHLFGNGAMLQTSFFRTDYHFDLSGSQSEFIFSLLSSVEDYALKSVLDHVWGNHRFSAGIELAHHQFTPNDIDVAAGDLVMNFLSYNRLYAYEGGVFVSDEFEISSRLALSLGIRYSFFNQTGPYTEYVYEGTSPFPDSVTYPAGASLAFYHHPEPRISARYRLNENASLKASYMHMAQYVHLATSSTVSLPTDIWLPSSRDIRPQYGDQYGLGFFRSFLDGAYEGSVELYYKQSRNQLEFLRGVLSNSLRLSLMDNIAIGKGRAYGLEFLLRRNAGRLTGWTGYTLSRSVRLFEEVNEGKIYPAKFDRRHDVSLAAMYKLNDRWNLSAAFIYVSGSAFTLPVARYVIEGNLVNEYGEVNNYRMPPYNRLDLSATRSAQWRNGMTSTWDFSVYNVYNRSNPFYIYFATTGNLDSYQLEVDPVMVTLFPIVPSVSWKFKF